MPFVKLDCGILKSTIWSDSDGRIVFLTALLMATPREYEVAVPQINVRDNDGSGWSAPPGWYGFVAAASTGIAKDAGLEIEVVRAALERLGTPDHESRSPEYDGRRLIRVNGGYLVLNFQKYRDHDYGAAERMRSYRSRQRSVTRNVTPVRRNVTQAEAEAEKEPVTHSAVVDSPENKHEESKALFTPPAFKTVWEDEILAVKIPKPAGKKRAEVAYRQKVRTADDYARFLRGLANYRASKRVKEGFVQDAGRWFSNFDEWADYSDEIVGSDTDIRAKDQPRTLHDRITCFAPNVYGFIRERGDPDSSEKALSAFEEAFERDISAPNGDVTRWRKWKRICGEAGVNPKCAMPEDSS